MFNNFSASKKRAYFTLSANIFEWYEYVVFAFLSEYLGVVFFGSGTGKESVFFTFTVMATGYLARPLGAVYFGLLSDKKGSAKALSFSLLLMAIPAFFILCIPVYEQVG